MARFDSSAVGERMRNTCAGFMYTPNWAMPLNFCTPEVEEQRNSSGVREKNGGIL